MYIRVKKANSTREGVYGLKQPSMLDYLKIRGLGEERDLIRLQIYVCIMYIMPKKNIWNEIVAVHNHIYMLDCRNHLHTGGQDTNPSPL